MPQDDVVVGAGELIPTASSVPSLDDSDESCADKCLADELTTTQVLWVTLASNTVFTASQTVAAYLSNSVKSRLLALRSLFPTHREVGHDQHFSPGLAARR